MTENPTPDFEPEKTGISRRTLAKGAAWTIPAVALAIGTPAMAASTPNLFMTKTITPAGIIVGGTTTSSTTVQITTGSPTGPGFAGQPVVFTITSGNATFTDGSTTNTNVSNGGGFDGASLLIKSTGTTNDPIIVTATSTGTNPTSVTFTIPVTVPAPVTILTKTSGDGQSTNVNGAFPNPLVATVSVGGSPVSGAPVTFTISGPASFVNGASTTTTFTANTNSSGTVTTPVLLTGTTAGTVTVTASSPGLTSVVYNLTIVPATAENYYIDQNIKPTVRAAGGVTANIFHVTAITAPPIAAYDIGGSVFFYIHPSTASIPALPTGTPITFQIVSGDALFSNNTTTIVINSNGTTVPTGLPANSRYISVAIHTNAHPDLTSTSPGALPAADGVSLHQDGYVRATLPDGTSWYAPYEYYSRP